MKPTFFALRCATSITRGPLAFLCPNLPIPDADLAISRGEGSLPSHQDELGVGNSQ